MVHNPFAGKEKHLHHPVRIIHRLNLVVAKVPQHQKDVVLHGGMVVAPLLVALVNLHPVEADHYVTIFRAANDLVEVPAVADEEQTAPDLG
jgi:hypothetical protein